MRTEETIVADMVAAKAEYHTAVETQPARICEMLSDRVKALRNELSRLLSAGANPCPECTVIVSHGVQGVEGIEDTDDVTAPRPPVAIRRYFSLSPTLVISLLEVGCHACKRRAIGINQRIAVRRWNEGQYAPEEKEAMPEAVAAAWADALLALEAQS